MLWLLILLPPLTLLLTLAGGALYAGREGGSSADISARVQRRFSGLLALALSLVGVALLVIMSVYPDIGNAIVWRSSSWRRDIILGVSIGALFAALYFTLLSPILTWLQRRIGDYVPPGSVLTTLEGNLPAFFVANVLLAPLVEEVWYRGVVYGWLEPLGFTLSILLTCLAFGLFHWPGGVWYVLLTGGMLGGALQWLRVEQAGLLAPYLAHLTLNAIEFYVVARRTTRKSQSVTEV